MSQKSAKCQAVGRRRVKGAQKSTSARARTPETCQDHWRQESRGEGSGEVGAAEHTGLEPDGERKRQLQVSCILPIPNVFSFLEHLSLCF